MDPLLIDSGPSPYGWSFYGGHSKCPHLGALARAGLLEDASSPRHRGSLGHVGMAHLHARWMSAQNGQDPAQFLEPEEAMRQYAYNNQAALPELGRMLETFRRYVARFPTPPGRRILGVECTATGVLGWVKGVWGLWLLDRPTYDRAYPLRHVSGADIVPARIDAPGHPRHGEPVLASRKWDLVIEDGAGDVWVVDFKFKSSGVSDKAAALYSSSGEFSLSRILGAQAWERFAGLGLWLVQTQEPFKMIRPLVPPTPARDAAMPNDILRLAQDIARLEVQYPNPRHWPRVSSEVVCSGNRYERDGCEAFGPCMMGGG